MRLSVSSIVKSLIIITILFIIFACGALFLKNIIYKNTKEALSIKSDNSLKIELNNNMPLSDRLALENNKDSVSSEVFKNIQFEIINKEDKKVNYEIYITKEEKDKNEINGKFIKIFLTKENGDIINGFDENNVPNYDSLNAISDMPGSRILYKGTIKGNGIEKFDFKTWISDSYEDYSSNEEFIYTIRVRVI